MREAQSLRAQLLLRLTLPLVVIVMLDAVVSYFVALHYADLAYDRWLLDSAHSLAQEVRARPDRVTLDLPPTALEVFRFDDVDETFFKIESRKAGFMAGDQAVPDPPDPELARQGPYYFDGEIQGRPVRVVSMLMAPHAGAEEVLMTVAETVNKRRAMMQEVLLASVVPQMLLILATGIHVRRGIHRGLQPLHQLTGTIAQRSPRDLAPIPDSDVPPEVRALTHTINELLQRLAQTVAAQRRFIENAAHQLRTPLAGLKLQAERAQRSNDLETMKPALAHIKNGADRVAHLSSQLLMLARAEPVMDGARMFREVDLHALTRSCCMDWVPRALERDIELAFEAPDHSITVTGDETLLRELLGNLLDNAGRYGREGGSITVKLVAGRNPALVVEDDGPGIPAGEMDKVLERFYRIPGCPGEGCGLGLAIVKEIAALHGAGLRLERAGPDGGLRVAVTFARSAV
jgi:two-component system sensor histidine kinase TctE